jgi:L-threonylcarbamoyladenylate synthase
VKDEFGDAVDLVLDGGACEVGIESTIIDCSGGPVRILRPGAITAAMLADALGFDSAAVAQQSERTRERIREIEKRAVARIGRGANNDKPEPPRVSGSMDAHYAPRTRLLLIASERLTEALAARADVPVAVLSRIKPAGIAAGHWQQAASDPAAYARELYAHLRDLDVLGADLMLIESPPQGPEWDGVNDRLRRAAFGSGEAPA